MPFRESGSYGLVCHKANLSIEDRCWQSSGWSKLTTYLTVDDSVLSVDGSALCVLQLGVEVGIVCVRHGDGWSTIGSE